MFPLRQEIQDFSHSCEHLLYTAASSSLPLTETEIQFIAYYAKEMMNLADQLIRAPGGQHCPLRHTVQEYAQVCEVWLRMTDLSEEERARVRCSLTDVTATILQGRQGARTEDS